MRTVSSPTQPKYELVQSSPTTKRSKLCTAVAAIAIVLIGLFLLPYIRFDTGDRHYFTGFRSDIKLRSYSSCGGGEEINSDNNKSVRLDFAIIGFPKTGTSFLFDVLKDHPDIVMGERPEMKYSYREFCQIHNKDGVEQTMAWLNNVSIAAAVSPKIYGIKCPTMVRGMSAIDNLVKMSDHTRLVVGVRHPLFWFESFYNFR